MSVPPYRFAANALAEKFGDAPKVALVLGSGMGPLVEALTQQRQVDFADVGLVKTTVSGHAGRVTVGFLGEPVRPLNA